MNDRLLTWEEEQENYRPKQKTERQYLDLIKRITKEGTWVFNQRTNTRCLTVINAQIRMEVKEDEFPLITTRRGYFRQAIGEIMGYLRGYEYIEDFHKLGVRTWDANANHPDWLDSIYNKKPGSHLGKIYGAAGNAIPHMEYQRHKPDSGYLMAYPNYKRPWLKDLLEKIKNREDDRGLIWSFWKPELFHLGCLRPCMYEHQFSILDDTLHVTSTMRSNDVVLGGSFNMIQSWFLCWVVARIAGLKPGTATINIVNAHIYENQLPLVSEQLAREPYDPPVFVYTSGKSITVESLLGECENEEDNLHPDDFNIINYRHHAPIKYPFTV